MFYDIAVIGAGASGLMLASLIKSKKVCIIDSNNEIGAKIKVSGGSKCNITNKYLKPSNFLGDSEFISEVLSKFDNDDLLHFLNSNNLFPKVNPKIIKGTYFCNSSSEVINMFKRLISRHTLMLDTTVKSLKEINDTFEIETSRGKINSKKIIVASGGISFANLGASDIGYKIAQQFGHTVNKAIPALVGFTVQKEQFWFKFLSGLSLPVIIEVNDKKLEGNMLFAHKGFSGPAVLNASLYWQKGKLSIDFLPNKKINTYLKSGKNISTLLPLPKRFVKEFLNSISLEDKPLNLLNSDEIKKLNRLKKYEFAPAGNFGFSKAEVTKGGVETSGVDVSTMESKLKKNLYFIGEVLDVTGELGGYNFQWAFSSAYVCAGNLTEKIQ